MPDGDSYSATLTPLWGERAVKVNLLWGEAQLKVADVLTLWRDDPNFSVFFTNHLAQTPFKCFRWETPPATTTRLLLPYEHVLTDAPTLVGRAPDQASFAAPLAALRPGETAAAFDNLGGDAALIAPAPLQNPADCTDLAAYCRAAPPDCAAGLWRAVGGAMRARLSETPLWLSTAGGGVAWLHVRIDQHPKYYRHKPYKTL